MKILTGEQIRQADRITASGLGIAPHVLMGMASESIAAKLGQLIPAGRKLYFFIGKGNNGGDGLAVAGLLSSCGYDCTVVLLYAAEDMSGDARFYLGRLPAGVRSVREEDFDWASIESDDAVAIDAVLGTGTVSAARGKPLGTIRRINASGCRTVAIDMPSGLMTEPDGSMEYIEAVKADVTVTVAFPKLSLLLPETGKSAGRIVVAPLKLDSSYLRSAGSDYYYTDITAVRRLLRARPEFAHKGDFGHALLVCGSKGMTGAAVLSTGAALRSGCGIVTVHLPACGADVIHATCPSAIVSTDSEDCFSSLPVSMDRYSAVGVGPGLGTSDRSAAALAKLLNCGLKTVLDADALNIIAGHRELLPAIPPGSILTPHLGELRRLVGDWSGPCDRMDKAVRLARRLSSCIVVKGAHTAVVSPDGTIEFNGSGNPGMAKGGSGDVLTGLITGLLASGYASKEAAVTGVWLHGLAGDIAMEKSGMEAMNSADISACIGESFKRTADGWNTL